MLDYRSVCLAVFPKNVDQTKWNAEDFYNIQETDIMYSGTTNVIVDSGLMSQGVPHYISTLPHILKMLNSTVDIFTAIPTRPLLATVATSRADHYLPDPQASLINTLVLRMLRRQYGPGVTVKRTDIPENTAEEVEPIRSKPPILYRGTKGKKKPVSR